MGVSEGWGAGVEETTKPPRDQAKNLPMLLEQACGSHITGGANFPRQ
jgi:hypothetical protein